MPEPVTDLAYKPRDCAAGQKWNWCVKACVPADSKMADCPPGPIPPIPPGTQPPPDKCIPGHPNCQPHPGGPPGHPGMPPGPPHPGMPPGPPHQCPPHYRWDPRFNRCTPGYPGPQPFPQPHPGGGFFPSRGGACYARYNGNCRSECSNPFNPMCGDCIRTCGGGSFPLPRRGYGYRYRCPGPPYSYPCPYPPFYWPVSYFPTGYPLLVSTDMIPLTTVINVTGDVGGASAVPDVPDTTPAPEPVDTAPPPEPAPSGLSGLLGGNSSIILIGLAVLVLIMVMKK